MPEFAYPVPAGVPTLGGPWGGGGVVRYDRTEAEYQADFADLSVTRGYRLIDLTGQQAADYLPRYSAIWEVSHRHAAQWSRHEIKAADYIDVFNERVDAGYRPVRVRGYALTSGTLFTAIWEKAGEHPEWKAHHKELVIQLAEHEERARVGGFRIVDLSGYVERDTEPDSPLLVGRFTSIWEKSDGPRWQIVRPCDAQVHERVTARLRADGWSVVTVSAWDGGAGAEIVMSLWEHRGTPLSEAAAGLDTAGCGTELAAHDRRGLRPVRLGGRASTGSGGTVRFYPVWTRLEAAQVIPPLVARFARAYDDVSAVALAVAKDGRLRYSHGFGIIDPISGSPVKPEGTRFRIASLAKPITSAAVFRLVERNLLGLDDTVFGTGGRLADLGTPVDDRAADITVRHLLQHTSGLATNDANDPMFQHRELTAAQLITRVMQDRRLDRDPGSGYAYSNLGNCVLGRVIEEVTGATYERHLRDGLLAECGITDMRIAGDRRSDRAPGEVFYYGFGGADPYDTPVHRMDSHGGWIATAVDVARFVTRVDGEPIPGDVLTAASVKAMTTPSGAPDSDGAAAGWGIAPDGTWGHTGRLAGTSAVVARTADGWSWAALANTSRADDDRSKDTLAGLDTLMWTIRDRVDWWPEGTDL